MGDRDRPRLTRGHASRPAGAGGKGPSIRKPATPGFSARQLAVRVISDVIERHRPFDDAFTRASADVVLDVRDRAFSRLIVATVLRRHGELATVLNSFLTRPLPDNRGRLWPILLSAAGQLLCLDTPPHAAISQAVDQARADQHARHFSGLVNAVLRRVATEGRAILATLDSVALNVPAWMLRRWQKQYGTDDARRIGMASLAEAALDISAKSEPEAWAARLGGTLLPTGSIRCTPGGRVDDLPGYADGAWWVQDAAAALPARILGPVAGLEIADLCAAPGGKTAQLAVAGARVTAVDQATGRVKRLEENLRRLALEAGVVVADAAAWSPGRTFDAVLLDAPCTSTGTIRRHPDILHVKREADVASLAALQARLIDTAAGLVKPGGILVYCTCSLEPEEGEQQIESFLARGPAFARVPLVPGESGIPAEWITRAGDLRTLPFHQPAPGISGLDGFFVSRLVRPR